MQEGDVVAYSEQGEIITLHVVVGFPSPSEVDLGFRDYPPDHPDRAYAESEKARLDASFAQNS